MKLRDLRIENYDWHVRFYFAVHGYHTRSILFSLEQIECPRPIMERVRENLEKADMDSGFTYSNKIFYTEHCLIQYKYHLSIQY